MHSEFILQLADIFQFLTIGITVIGFIPQIRRLLVLKSSKEMSTTTWAVWSIGSFMAFFYALTHHIHDGCCFPLVCTSLINFVLSGIVLGLVMYYKRGDRHSILAGKKIGVIALASMENKN